MKKLIIAAAIVCAAVVANAAAINWTASAVLDPEATAAAGKNTPGTGWLGYCILASNLESVTDGLNAGDTTALLAASLTDAGVASSKGAMNVTGGSVEAGSKDFYMIVLNATTLEDATGYYVSNKVNATVDASLDTTVGFGSQATASKATANWTAMSVPEPTSGLLLLLGMAGLALKRKRA